MDNLLLAAQRSEDLFGNAGSQRESLGAFVVNMVKQEGVGSLWKGFTNNFARIGSLLSSLPLLLCCLLCLDLFPHA